MFPTDLNTNEVKNAAGTEEEFLRFDNGQPRTIIFAKSGEVYSRQHRITIKHSEAGLLSRLTRRSLLRVDKTVISDIDSITPCTISSYCVTIVPMGLLNATTEVANVQANLMSVLASKGLSTTILYDNTGYGAAALLAGSL